MDICIKTLWKNTQETISNDYWEGPTFHFISSILLILNSCQPQTSYKICLKSFPACSQSSTLKTVTNTLCSNLHYKSNNFKLVYNSFLVITFFFVL